MNSTALHSLCESIFRAQRFHAMGREHLVQVEKQIQRVLFSLL